MGWSRTLYRKGNTLRRLSRERRGSIARAWLALTLIQLALRFLPYRLVKTRLASAIETPPAAQNHQDRQHCRRLAADVAVAARNHFLSVSCLGRSLALHALCRRAGCATRLRIGVCRTPERVRAHAWLEAGGEILNDTSAVTHTFTVLERLPERQPMFIPST